MKVEANSFCRASASRPNGATAVPRVRPCFYIASVTIIAQPGEVQAC